MSDPTGITKLPLDLKIVAVLFILTGADSLFQMIAGASQNSLIIAIHLVKLLCIPTGIGLFMKRKGWRTMALIFNWLGVSVIIPVALIGKAGAAFILLFLCLSIWPFWVLIRRRNRELFGLTEPVRFVSLTVRSVAAALLIIIGIPAAINIADEDISPDARRLLDFSPVPLLKEQNASYALIGFDAAESEDPAKVGQLIVGDFRAELLKHWNEGHFEYDEARIIQGESMQIKGNADLLCRPGIKGWAHQLKPSDCLNAYRKQRDETIHLLSENKTLLSRYLSLFEYKGMVEDAPFTIESPTFGSSLHKAHKLMLTKAVMHWSEKEYDSAVELLGSDLRFWRRALQSSHTLVGKVLPLSKIQGDLAVILEMAQDRNADNEAVKRIRNILTPLNDSEKDMSPVVRCEFIVLKTELERTQSAGAFHLVAGLGKHTVPVFLDRLLARLFLKPNATINFAYSDYSNWFKLAKLDSREFRGSKSFSDGLPGFGEGWAKIYNPLGKFFLNIHVPAVYQPYIQRVHDTDALMRLAALQAEIRLQDVSQENMEAFLKAADPSLSDPYTGLPMLWDQKTGTLFSVGNSLAERGEPESIISIPVVFFSS